MTISRTLLLYAFTALVEIIGCYLSYLVLRKAQTAWLLIPAAFGLALFAWLLTLHPAAAGRTYAAYGGVYVITALAWLWVIEKQQPNRWDLIGVATTLAGMLIIAFAPRN